MKLFAAVFFSLISTASFSQTPKSYSSSDILQGLEKLKVFGSVLYIAAHPDDENTRLLAYLANERKLRTGYLSLTRGDGGQNLIGDEQGIELGLIRTQELLAARRVDGAEQFFTRAYDFGYSKSPDEALKTWGHDKILSDVVWVIRKFKPDVIITRFPTTGEGGHGHHTASAILAEEAFDAAADSTKFSEQLTSGIKPWQAKRLFWNTFNFGGNNTTREDQLKIDVGIYNPVLGKSYGEMAAESRSQHKSQGFGVPAQRGESFEYFKLIKGDKVQQDLMDGIETGSQRMTLKIADKASYEKKLNEIIAHYNPLKLNETIQRLCQLQQFLEQSAFDFDAKKHLNDFGKKIELQKLILKASGLFVEATVANQLNVVGDSLQYTIQFNNRLGLPVKNVQVSILGNSIRLNDTTANKVNTLITEKGAVYISKDRPATQPYWLEFPMEDGAFSVHNRAFIGMPEINTVMAHFQLRIFDKLFSIAQPVFYKYTDPVKGELYEQPQFVNPAFVNVSPSLIIFSNNKKGQKRNLDFMVQSNLNLDEKISFETQYNGYKKIIFDSSLAFSKMDKKVFRMELNSDMFEKNSTTAVLGQLKAASLYESQMFSLAKISYNHIPDIYYNYLQRAKVIKMDLEISGSHIGYINGAGDKVPQALQQMGYEVTMLTEKDITPANLQQFDAIVTGVRAYNTNLWLAGVNAILNNYVKEGGVLLVQYNTNNNAGPLRQKIGPYPFTLGRSRVTDETATVNFLLPNDPLLNYPNKITSKDFEGWIQERSVYHAENIDKNYRSLFSMKDPGETENSGSTIVADYGKGRFIYTGLVFFRELPAGVPGAYRLLANFLAKPKNGTK